MGEILMISGGSLNATFGTDAPEVVLTQRNAAKVRWKKREIYLLDTFCL
jgi:hypothetical protein